MVHGLDEEKDESTDNKVLNIFKETLGLNSLKLEDIGRSHRLGKKENGKKRPIIVRFATYRQKAMVYSNKRKLKGTRTVISENLTPSRYALYKKCLDRFGSRNVWTYDGRIYYLTGNKLRNGDAEKKVITTEEDLLETVVNN